MTPHDREVQQGQRFLCPVTSAFLGMEENGTDIRHDFLNRCSASDCAILTVLLVVIVVVAVITALRRGSLSPTGGYFLTEQ